jgi:hypothetical protein
MESSLFDMIMITKSMSIVPEADKEHDILKAYSRGEIDRQDVGDRLGEPLGFGDLLMKLHEHHLPLPRFPSDRNSPGVQLIKRLAMRAPRISSEFSHKF